ncbi:MAG TPA: hemerythrin domain-containing protein [Bacteroidota bacterium]|nr:hemerythrin domain-containing protein [Bacteroidota bacterium]
MRGRLYDYFASDHRRLENLLDRAVREHGEFEMDLYARFRAGLLKHIGMEEKILLPAAQRRLGGTPLPIAAKIRLDHGAIAALMVPPPSATIIAALRDILAKHDLLEEQPAGLYETCERLTEDEVTTLLEKLQKFPDVPVMPFNNKAYVIDATRRALARAGYNFDDYMER